MAASPLIVDDKVIVLPGGLSGKSVVAYNKKTGARFGECSTIRRLTFHRCWLNWPDGVRSLSLVRRVWSGSRLRKASCFGSYPWDTDMGINVSQPIVVDRNRFFISSGYGKGAALVEVKGSGNSFTASTIWENKNMKNKFNSSVLHNGYVYGLDEGIIVCLDVNTGERKWKEGRYRVRADHPQQAVT